MKTFLKIIALLLFAPLAFAQTASNQYKHINTAWTPPVIGGNVYPACNFTANPPVNTACVNGYQEVLTPPTGTNGNTNIISPCTASQSTLCMPWGISSYSWTPGGYLYVGTWNVSLVTAYLDSNGVQQFSSAITGTVVVPNPTNPPNPATGLNVTLAP